MPGRMRFPPNTSRVMGEGLERPSNSARSSDQASRPGARTGVGSTRVYAALRTGRGTLLSTGSADISRTKRSSKRSSERSAGALLRRASTGFIQEILFGYDVARVGDEGALALLHLGAAHFAHL